MPSELRVKDVQTQRLPDGTIYSLIEIEYDVEVEIHSCRAKYKSTHHAVIEATCQRGYLTMDMIESRVFMHQSRWNFKPLEPCNRHRVSLCKWAILVSSLIAGTMKLTKKECGRCLTLKESKLPAYPCSTLA